MESNRRLSDSQQTTSRRPRRSNIPTRQASSRHHIPTMAYDSDLGGPLSLEELGQRSVSTFGESVTEQHPITDAAAQHIEYLRSFADFQRPSEAYNHTGPGWYTTSGIPRSEESDILASLINGRPSRDHRETLSHREFLNHILDTGFERSSAIPDPDEIARFESSIFDPNRPSSRSTRFNNAGEPARPDTPDTLDEDMTYRLQDSSGRAPTPHAAGVFYPSDHLNGRWHRRNRFGQSLPLNRPTISNSTTMLPSARDRPASEVFNRRSRAYLSTEGAFAHPRISSLPTANSSETLHPELGTPIMTPTSSASDGAIDVSVLRVTAVPEQSVNLVAEQSINNGSASTAGEDSMRLDGSGRPAPIPVTILISIEFDDTMFDIQGYDVTMRPRSRQVGEE
ncbi:hypothetical protein F4814DRAFT_455988 [Daldinia grandis]|nr:hypothetical protein F4814DRAFT_455988 [Daldinia grandis]